MKPPTGTSHPPAPATASRPRHRPRPGGRGALPWAPQAAPAPAPDPAPAAPGPVRDGLLRWVDGGCRAGAALGAAATLATGQAAFAALPLLLPLAALGAARARGPRPAFGPEPPPDPAEAARQVRLPPGGVTRHRPRPFRRPAPTR